MVVLVNLLILLACNSACAVLKSLGASPRDGSSPSSGTRDFTTLGHSVTVAFLFQYIEIYRLCGKQRRLTEQIHL